MHADEDEDVECAFASIGVYLRLEISTLIVWASRGKGVWLGFVAARQINPQPVS